MPNLHVGLPVTRPNSERCGNFLIVINSIETQLSQVLNALILLYFITYTLVFLNNHQYSSHIFPIHL